MRGVRARRLRLGTVAASVSTSVALTSHVAAGGGMPGAVGILLPLLVAIAVCIRLAALRHSLVRLGLSVAASQFAFHTLFVFGSRSAPTSSAPAVPHAHHVDPAAALAAFGTAGTVHSGHEDASMWFLHAIAAVVTTLALHRGESVLAALGALRAFVARMLALPRLARPAIPVPPSSPRLTLDLPWVPFLQERVATCLGLRGPPLGPFGALPAMR